MASSDKLSTSLLVDPQQIPYVPMNRTTSKRRGFFQACDPRDPSLYCVIPFLIVVALFGVLFVSTQYDVSITLARLSRLEQQKDLKWNEVIFTQLWGYSSCLQFKDKHYPNGVTCRYENDPAFWSIHGIWPTRAGSMGPNFCSKVKFDINLLESIRPSLDQYWYEIDSTKQGNYFWSHEWEKHGSCAMEANEFDTELKYFNTGLDLHKKYDLYSVLNERGIVPESPSTANGYTLDQITDAIVGAYGAEAVPYVQCLAKKNDATGAKDFYLLAVQLCFDKDLELMTCKHSRSQNFLAASRIGDNAMPCPANAQIKYLDATKST